MAVVVTEFSPGSGGSRIVDDSLTTVDGAAAPTTSRAQMAKVGFGAQNEYRSVSESQPLPASSPLRRTTDLSGAAINATTAGDTTLVAAVAGQTTRVHRMWFMVGGSTTITVRSASTALTGPMSFGTGGSFVLDLSDRPHFTTGTNEPLILASTAAVQISGRLEFVTGA